MELASLIRSDSEYPKVLATNIHIAGLILFPPELTIWPETSVANSISEFIDSLRVISSFSNSSNMTFLYYNSISPCILN